MTEKFPVFEVDIGYFFRAEFTNSFAADSEPLWTWHVIWPFYFNRSETSVPILKLLYGLGDRSSFPDSKSGDEGSAGTLAGAFFCLAALIFSERLTA